MFHLSQEADFSLSFDLEPKMRDFATSENELCCCNFWFAGVQRDDVFFFYTSRHVLPKSPKLKRVHVLCYYCRVPSETDCKLKARESPSDSTESEKVVMVERVAIKSQVRSVLRCRTYRRVNDEVIVTSSGKTSKSLGNAPHSPSLSIWKNREPTWRRRGKITQWQWPKSGKHLSG